VAATPAIETEARFREALKYFETWVDRELTEVRWVSLAEAEELMGDMSEVARDHLRRTLRRGN
jgi:hypothetical protein